MFHFRAASTQGKTLSPHVSCTALLQDKFFIAEARKVGFYTSFGRPVAKVFLGAMFTYQLAYLLWHKLEIEELKAYKTGTLRALYLEDHRLLIVGSSVAVFRK